MGKALFCLLAWVFLLSACREGKQKSVEVKNVSNWPSDVSFSLSLCANSQLLFEGGTDPVGMISDMSQKDFARLFPFLKALNQPSERVVWAYELIPQTVRIEGSQAIVIGKVGEKGMFYFSTIEDENLKQVKLLFSERRQP